MDQIKIGKFIKEIRLKENMSQKDFAHKYGVTFQAVSKWENGKNIPDIAILKAICEDYNMNLDDLLETKIPKEKNRLPLLILSALIFVLIVTTIFIMFTHTRTKFEFKALSTSCGDFDLYGSIAYDNQTSSIYITNITYCGDDVETEYIKVNCTLYERDGNDKMKISTYNYDKNRQIDLETFLEKVEFKIDNYNQTCEEYEDNSLYLEITATKEDDTATTYEIPLTLEDNCTK